MADGTAQPNKPTTKELAHKRKLFIEFYLGEAKGNGTKAARLAGYEFPSEEAYRLLRIAQVRARIDERLAETAMTAAEVLAETSDIARAEWRDFIEVLEWDEHGNPVRVKMDLRSKVESLKLLATFHGLLTQQVQVGGDIKIEVVGVNTDLI